MRVNSALCVLPHRTTTRPNWCLRPVVQVSTLLRRILALWLWNVPCAQLGVQLLRRRTPLPFALCLPHDFHLAFLKIALPSPQASTNLCGLNFAVPDDAQAPRYVFGPLFPAPSAGRRASASSARTAGNKSFFTGASLLGGYAS